MSYKLNVLLAKTDGLASVWKNLLRDYGKFFKNSQEAFRGEQRIYNPKDGTVDDPKKRGNVLVQATVGEKLDYFSETASPYIDALFSQEATNASGNATAELVVGGESWGVFTSLELLRLKSLLDTNDMNSMYQMLPVRSDSYEWEKSNVEMYSGRAGIYQGPVIESENRTTIKEEYILPDPNLANIEGSKYVAQKSVRNITVVLGNGSQQRFTGEISQRERAEVLKRISTLKIAVIEALKVANEVEVVESSLTAKKLFGYIHGRA